MSVNVRVQLAWPIWKTVGRRSTSVELEGTPAVADVLARLGADHPGFERELALGAGGGAVQYALFLNDSQVRREDAARTPVRDGDKLHVILPIIGGWTRA